MDEQIDTRAHLYGRKLTFVSKDLKHLQNMSDIAHKVCVVQIYHC